VPTTPGATRQLLRRLAEWPPSEMPVISAYLDLRPQATGQNPQVRSGQIVLRDRLREIERSLEPHSPQHESFSADAERIKRHVEEEALPAAQGLAIFACHGERRFEALETLIEAGNEVSVGAHPRLLPLARLADTEQALVALADTNTLRMFALSAGGLDEIGLVDDEPDDYGKRDMGGWSQARFQRHVEAHRAEFAALAADAVDQVAQQEEAGIVVMAGDEVALPLLRERLPQRTSEMVRGVLRIDMRATLDQVERQVLPFLAKAQSEAATDAADRLFGAVRGDGLGAGGVAPTRRALELGQVTELIVDAAADFGEDVGEELVRRAAATDAGIRFVEGHAGLRELGGVGGLLRFRLEGGSRAAEVGASSRSA
jgi:hypothetical protein